MMTDEQREYVDSVLARLPPFTDEQAMPSVAAGILYLREQGFSFEDNVAFHRVLENVDPTIDEDVACFIQANIWKKYSR